ncbi:hypothetical protein HPB47_024546 [Ixodes persulcatus]|uniref:Uncharacterized protein n=1 Tax=Ixodes persulcatus TaxID=34615 RepID=A0AC60Q3Z7_IXOPE|nr:hypothetical protein HPB47_024546 [Ixodes persulcatus]
MTQDVLGYHVLPRHIQDLLLILQRIKSPVISRGSAEREVCDVYNIGSGYPKTGVPKDKKKKAYAPEQFRSTIVSDTRRSEPALLLLPPVEEEEVEEDNNKVGGEEEGGGDAKEPGCVYVTRAT